MTDVESVLLIQSSQAFSSGAVEIRERGESYQKSNVNATCLCGLAVSIETDTDHSKPMINELELTGRSFL